jgi:guanylate kinase
VSGPGHGAAIRPARLTVLAGPTAVGKGTVAAYIRRHHPET